ncbi:hypothetical protein V6N11_063494 [Hibiscus sabdariffa]|uniref:RNase H type-1 domain-containing protein n=1 Tax=Hibiscus sabdariffa TaxID=183260 RepID=A0ABR1ZRX2_9ROSI
MHRRGFPFAGRIVEHLCWTRSMQLVQKSRSWDFQWIPREMNMVADCLSKMAPPPQFQLLVFDDEHESVQSFVVQDIKGLPIVAFVDLHAMQVRRTLWLHL